MNYRLLVQLHFQYPPTGSKLCPPHPTQAHALLTYLSQSPHPGENLPLVQCTHPIFTHTSFFSPPTRVTLFPSPRPLRFKLFFFFIIPPTPGSTLFPFPVISSSNFFLFIHTPPTGVYPFPLHAKLRHSTVLITFQYPQAGSNL